MVVGYGVQKKVNLTGAVTAVDTKDLEDRTTHNLTDMLQGAVPGLNITTSSGNPGSSGSLNIRGITSINAADPLVLVDGVEADMSRVNANDVENISVIKDASAAAIYGARAAYGVILITTKSGSEKGGKATVRYSGRMGWEEPTVSTDFETRGYWSVYTVDKFWATDAGKNYTTYTEHDMAELLARVNDVTENPERPWVVEEIRNGRKQWVYYANTDWYHELYNDRHPVQQHSVSITGGNKDVKYFLSGAYDRQSGVIKLNPDVFQKYNLRAKIDARLNKVMRLSNNTSFFSSAYDYPGGSLALREPAHQRQLQRRERPSPGVRREQAPQPAAPHRLLEHDGAEDHPHPPLHPDGELHLPDLPEPQPVPLGELPVPPLSGCGL